MPYAVLPLLAARSTVRLFLFLNPELSGTIIVSV